MNEAKPNRSTEAAPKQRFGESLVTEGKITQQQLDLALRQQSKKGGLIGQILVELGFASGRVVAQQVAREAQVPFVDVTLQRAEAAALQRIPFFLARQFVALPLMLEAGLLTVAMANPSNIYAVDALQKESGLPIEVVAAPEGDIITLLDKYYSTTENIEVTIARAMEETDLAVTVVEKAVDLSATDDMDAPVIRLVSHILARAVDQGASDIHFEPEQRIMRIRTRIDGELFQDILIPKPRQPFGIAQRKLAGLSRYLQTGVQDLARGVRGIHVELDGDALSRNSPCSQEAPGYGQQAKVTANSVHIGSQ